MGLIITGMSEIKVANPPNVLATYALGSCLGVCLLDPKRKIAGMAHIMLPDSGMAPARKNAGKFVDTAIPELVRQMELAGAMRGNLCAKLAGGAQMFQPRGDNNNPIWQVGQRNVEEARALLAQLGIPIVAHDVLKHHGRSLVFDPETGRMTVRTLNMPDAVL